MSAFDFAAYVVASAFDRRGQALFALADGSVRVIRPGGWLTAQAHDGAVLCAAPHPSGAGLITGGDDGAVVWTRLEGAELAIDRLAQHQGRWIETLAASADSGLIAYAAGRELCLLDAKDRAFTRRFAHERSIAGLAFDPKGRRVASATYGGVLLWWPRIADQKPQFLKWAGSHIGLVWSPDGKFIVSAMQDNQLHGWRLSDAKDMRMGGYPAKVKSLAFLAGGRALATSGSRGAVVWPFTGADGPMGKEAAEIGYEETTMVTRVAGAQNRAAGGTSTGKVWLADLTSGRTLTLREAGGAPISALTLSADGGRLAYGDEEGGAWLIELDI
jgi:WD40 repeat protein